MAEDGRLRVELALTDKEAQMLEEHLGYLLSRTGQSNTFRAWAGTMKVKVMAARTAYRERRAAQQEEVRDGRGIAGGEPAGAPQRDVLCGDAVCAG